MTFRAAQGNGLVGMTDVRELWWRAGRPAYPVSTDTGHNDAWVQSVRRSATLLEPAWPTDLFSGGPFEHALPTVALVLYAGGVDSRPEYVPVDKLTAPQRGSGKPSFEDIVREGPQRLRIAADQCLWTRR